MASRPIISPAEPTTKPPAWLQPNAHPYAVKTTSSALLSRSNSSPHSAQHARHHYVPSSPTCSVADARVRHRHHHSSSSSSSVDGEVPAPLPTPPAAALPGTSMSLRRADDPTPPRRTRRAETMPSSSAPNPVSEHHNCVHKDRYDGQDAGPELYAGLPSNPKQWNAEELAAYLETSFRGDGADDPNLVAILECVRARGLTGRELLRLTDADLVSTSLSDVQRAQILERSRTLRADALRGRIYVDSYHSREVSDRSNDIYSRSVRSSTPFHSTLGPSISADDLRLHRDNDYEGEAAFLPFQGMSLHRSNSVSEASTQRYKDLARMRARRRGRVKGLVETWERASTSGSECSASEGSVSGSDAECESETDPELDTIPDSKRQPEPLQSALHEEPPFDVCSPTADATIVLHHTPSLPPPPPYTHTHTALGVAGDEEEEPSIEELLASSPSVPLSGARAWEADIGLGETVKRIPNTFISASAEADSASSLAIGPDTSRRPNDKGEQSRGESVRSKGERGSTGSRGKKARSEKRVVTAIFAGNPSNDVSETAGDGLHLVGVHRHASGLNGVHRGEAPAGLDLMNDSDGALHALEESIAATQAQLEALRLRLEAVEADTARREAELKLDQQSVPRHSPECESKQRQSQSTEQATVETVEPPADETLGEGARNQDMVEDWKTMTLGDVARAVVARAMGWVFPYAHPRTRAPADQERSLAGARAGEQPRASDGRHSPVRRSVRLHAVRMSCIIWVSFAICAAVLRRMGFGRWVRRP